MTSLPFYYNDFHGGLNTRDSPFLLTDDQARDLQNVQGTTAGAIVKRPGLVTLGALPGTSIPKDLFAYEDVSSGGKLIVGTDGAIYSMDASGTSTAIATSGLLVPGWEWVQSQSVAGSGPVYGMNGVNTPQQWSGSGLTTNWVATTGTVPNGRYLLQAGNRLWVAGVDATPSRVFFSDLIPANNGPVTWPAANVAIFDENDGEPITGLGHVGPYILVTKARKLFVITDMNTGDGRRLSDSVGCASHRSIAESSTGTFFLGADRGVYLTNGSTVKPVSDQIQPTIDSIATRSRSAGIVYGNHYYLSVGITPSITPSVVLDYDMALDSWWLHTFGSRQFAIWGSNLNGAGLFSAKADPANRTIVDQCFVPGVTTDNGTAFTWRWRGPWQSPTFYRRRRFPTPYFKKRFRQIRVEGAGSVDVSIGTDFAGGEVLWQSNVFSGPPTTFGAADGSTFGGAGLFGDAATIGHARIYSVGVHSAISVVFSATSTTTDAVYEYTLMVTDRKDLVVS